MEIKYTNSSVTLHSKRNVSKPMKPNQLNTNKRAGDIDVTSKTEVWEVTFDKMLSGCEDLAVDVYEFGGSNEERLNGIKKFKSFIRSQIKAAREEVIGQVLDSMPEITEAYSAISYPKFNKWLRDFIYQDKKI